MNGSSPPRATTTAVDWPRGLLGLVALAGAAFATVAAGLVVITLVPNTGSAVSTVWPWVFGAAFPVWGVGLAMALSTFPRRLGKSGWWPRGSGFGELLDLVAWLPTATRWIVGALLVLGFVNSAASLGALDGQPVTMQGRYYADNHGELTELSTTEYDDALRAEARGFAGSALMFHTLGAALIVASSRRRSHLRVSTQP